MWVCGPGLISLVRLEPRKLLIGAKSLSHMYKTVYD